MSDEISSLARIIARSGMAGGPPLHDSHRDAICVAVNPHEYECPDCKARGADLALPCSPKSTDPA